MVAGGGVEGGVGENFETKREEEKSVRRSDHGLPRKQKRREERRMRESYQRERGRRRGLVLPVTRGGQRYRRKASK